MALGIADGSVLLYDISAQCTIRQLPGGCGGDVQSLSWAVFPTQPTLDGAYGAPAGVGSAGTGWRRPAAEPLGGSGDESARGSDPTEQAEGATSLLAAGARDSSVRVWDCRRAPSLDNPTCFTYPALLLIHLETFQAVQASSVICVSVYTLVFPEHGTPSAALTGHTDAAASCSFRAYLAYTASS